MILAYCTAANNHTKYSLVLLGMDAAIMQAAPPTVK